MRLITDFVLLFNKVDAGLGANAYKRTLNADSTWQVPEITQAACL